jgi:hypothetical protein
MSERKGPTCPPPKMPEAQGGGAAAGPEPKKQRDWEEHEPDESEGPDKERRLPDEDEQGAGQESAGSAV